VTIINEGGGGGAVSWLALAGLAARCPCVADGSRALTMER
jgi:hypothetical protein